MVKLEDELIVSTLEAQIKFGGPLTPREESFAQWLIGYYAANKKLTDDGNARGYKMMMRVLKEREHNF